MCTTKAPADAFCFAFVPQRYMVKARVQAEPPAAGVNMCYLLTPPQWGLTLLLSGGCACFDAPVG